MAMTRAPCIKPMLEVMESVQMSMMKAKPMVARPVG